MNFWLERKPLSFGYSKSSDATVEAASEAAAGREQAITLPLEGDSVLRRCMVYPHYRDGLAPATGRGQRPRCFHLEVLVILVESLLNSAFTEVEQAKHFHLWSPIVLKVTSPARLTRPWAGSPRRWNTSRQRVRVSRCGVARFGPKTFQQNFA